MPRPSLPEFVLAFACAAALSAAPAWAERADRGKPMVVEADRSAIVDMQRQLVVYAGNAVVSQGSMLLRAERIEMRETADGYRRAAASGMPGKPVSWRQSRDGAGETVEGNAERVEFDGRADTLRLVGDAVLRLLRNGVVSYEVTGGVIVWDNASEVFKVEGGTVSPVNPTGRVRAVIIPPAAWAASAPSASLPPVPLTPSRTLGGQR